MKCNNCYHPIPDDSEFCSFCGKRVLSPGPEQEPISKASSAVQELIEAKEVTSANRRKLPVIITAVLALLLVVSCVLNVLQYSNRTKMTSRVTELTTEYDAALTQAQKDAKSIESLQKQLASQEKDIDELSSKITSLLQENTNLSNANNVYSTSSKAFSQISNAAQKSPVGFVSSNFYVNTGVVTVTKGQSKTIRLVASWYSGGTVTISRDNTNASLEITDSSWSTSTTVNITGKSKGVTIATFSSTAESKSFVVIVIVT